MKFFCHLHEIWKHFNKIYKKPLPPNWDGRNLGRKNQQFSKECCPRIGLIDISAGVFGEFFSRKIAGKSQFEERLCSDSCSTPTLALRSIPEPRAPQRKNAGLNKFRYLTLNTLSKRSQGPCLLRSFAWPHRDP